VCALAAGVALGVGGCGSESNDADVDSDGTGGDGGTGTTGDAGGPSGSSGTGGTVVEPPIDGCSNVTSGWTELVPAADTRVVYVSDSDGSDANDGTSEASPVQTLDRARELMRSGSPDWMLLRRGDVFLGQRLGNWTLTGPSPDEPVVIGAYGDESERRPVIVPPDGSAVMQVQGGGGVDSFAVLENLVITSLHLHARWRDPDEPDFTGPEPGTSALTILRPLHNVLFEDLLVESFSNVVIQPAVPDGEEFGGVGFTMRRCVVVDNYNLSDSGHSQGIFITGVDEVLFEENVFDHNGWREGIAGAEATMFNHNFYVQRDCGHVVLHRNVIARASSHGFQLRPHGIAEDNLVVGNAIAGFVAGDNEISGMLQVLRGNVVLHAGQHLFDDGSDRAWGLELINPLPDVASEVSATDNIVAHSGPLGRSPLVLDDTVSASGNVIYEWGGQSDPGPFVDPSRSLETYHESIGGAATVEAFLGGTRAQRRGHWCYEYTTDAVLPYIREGFEQAP
jgi:hypothetical protein